MRFTIGHFFVLTGALLIVGPGLAPSLYDPFAASITVFFGVALGFLGLTFRKILPGIHARRPGEV